MLPCPAPLSPHVRTVTLFDRSRPLVLASGRTLSPVTVAYETYGQPNDDQSNFVFLCHALTGDSHPAAHAPGDTPAWWDFMVGPGRPVDTDMFFVICANVLGGCAGTTGPWSPGPDGRPHGPDFPPFDISDIVTVHRALLAHLGIARLRAVLGGSLGGMQALDWLLHYPDDAVAFLIIAASARQSAENLAWNAVARAAIRSDPRFRDGRYPPLSGPGNGLGLARMVGHLTYVSEEALELKFGRRLRESASRESAPTIEGPFAVESYLEHQAASLAKRFDANTYLYLLSAMDRFNAFSDDSLPRPCRSWPEVHLFTFASDRLYGYAHSRYIRDRLAQVSRAAWHHHDAAVTFGHDAFLLDVPGYLARVARILRHQDRGV